MSELLIGLINPMNYGQVNQFFKRCRYPAKATAGEKVFVVKSSGKIIGAAKLKHRPDDTWLLRAICVHPDWRKKGIGSQLLDSIQSVINQDYCYCFVYNHLIEFYEASGFVYADDTAPIDLSQAFEHYCGEGRKIVLMVRYPERKRVSG